MKITAARANNHRRAFELECARGVYPFPFSRAEPEPTPDNPVAVLSIDSELASEAIAYRLASGAEGFVHLEQALDYNADPTYLRELLLHRLSIEAQEQVATSGLSKREIMRRLGTSPAQLYRLLDQTNTRKSIDGMVALLEVLGCEVDVIVREKTA